MVLIKAQRNLLATLSLWVAICAGLSACSHSQNRKDVLPSAEYAPYVNAYTGGVISQNSAIRIELTKDQSMVDLHNELKDNPFRFSPSLKGKAYWVSNNTIEFVPEEGALRPGTFYEATFRLGDFVEVDSKLKDFPFSFRVQERNFTLHTSPITVTREHPDQIRVEGEIRFSDSMKKESVEKMLSAVNRSNGQSYAVEVTPTDQPSRYEFAIPSVARTDTDFELEIKADGKAADINREEILAVTIPAQGNFRFLSARRIDQPENGVEIVFSDPVSNIQDLKGLIEIPEINNFICEVKGNKVNVYFEVGKLQNISLRIHEGVKNWEDRPLGTSHELSFSQRNLKPQVEIPVSAAILPDSKNLVIPFRAVNLYAVDLRIVRIFENNVPMFMQENSLASQGELRRWGRLVYQKTLWLAKDSSKDVHRWEDYSIDLAGLIHQEPGAIYRIFLSFTQEYSAYPCDGEDGKKDMQFSDGSSEQLTKVSATTLPEEEEAEWDIPSSYYYYNGGNQMDWSQYRWEDRDNPCRPTYYMVSNRYAACNVFASNLGMTVKRNSINKLWIAVNNMLDTKPVEKAKLTAYNFQLQPIAHGETDNNGFNILDPRGVPFLVVAEANGQKAYVKVADGQELSVSRFDAGGKEIQKGLKGFIYGERGVWRPGDTLHVAFILEDRDKRIPDKHPVALELYNPKGQFYAKMVSTNGLNGFYTFDVATQTEDPTGFWNAYVKVGGTTFHKSLRIETVKPNRLKIHLQLPSPVLKASDKEVNTTLSSSWLTGATASRLKAKVEMSLSKVNTQFKNYKQYIFNNPATEFTSQQSEVFSGTLDDNGDARFLLKLPEAANAPGMLNANLTARVFEPGGDASIYTQTVPFSPFTAYVGVNLNQPKEKSIETDKDHIFDVVTVNAEGKPVNRSNLEYRIYRIQWSWWWEHADESLGTYINNSSIAPVASGKITTVNGKASIRFRVNYPDWGRYLVYVKDKESGHASGGTVYIDWPEWRGRSNKTDPSGVKMLTFSLDKSSYTIGETVTAILPASAGGRALVALENGSTVLQQEWIEVSGQKDTKYQFKVTPEMAPNVYLHINLLQPHAQTVNDLPIRMYGLMPVFVTDKETVLQPQLQVPEVLRPETAFNITVSEKSGKPMTYTLAIVDDGLLDLTNFKTPDPWNEFYAREALGIRTWDMYDDVLGAKAGSYGSMFSTGGDQTLKPADDKANRFKPVVKFIGPFYLGKGKQRIHQVTLPMYVGSVRTMLIAGQDGAYGNAEKTSYVRSPLMILSSLPRVMSTGEEILVPVNVFAMEKNVKDVAVSLKVSGGGLQVAGPAQQSLTFAQTGDQLAFFRIKSGDKTGKAVISLAASGNGQHAKETIEIEVRNPNPVVTLRQSKWIEAGASEELTYALSTTSQGNQVRLEVSRIPSVDLTRRFDFLYNYEYSCTEQLVSKALPLLFVTQFKAVNAEESEHIKKNIEEGIRQVYARQLPNGGFVYWPGNASADEWITSYTGMFLTLAQEKGYAVNPTVLNKWQRFQRAAAQNWRSPSSAEEWMRWQSDLQQAFRLYTLALANMPEQGAMNRMKEMPSLPQQARWRLAAAYALTGKPKAAGELVYQAKTTVTPYSPNNRVYGSSDRDEAMILETLVLMDREREALEQAKIVSRNLSQENWFTTQSTAFSLMAMGRLAEKLSGTIDLTWTLNGKPQEGLKSAKAVVETELPLSPLQGTVKIQNRGKGVLNADLITRTQLLNDTLPALSNNLSLNVEYFDMNHRQIGEKTLRQGTDFYSVITVSNISGTTDYTNLALTHIVPSGWEIYNERMVNGENASGTAVPYTYRDIRDDRVLTYFDLNRGESKTFRIRLQASYAGEYVLPAILCEAMYDSNAQARTQAGRCIVSR